MRYLVLNGIVLVLTIFAAVFLTKRRKFPKNTTKLLWLTLAIVLGLTAVFDSLIIAAGIVGYNADHILGIFIGRAPIEDFAYACVSVVLVVVLWEYYEHRS